MTPPVLIKVHRSVLRGFVRRSWNVFPNEHIEGIIGRRYKNVFVIFGFTPLEYKSNPVEVVFTETESFKEHAVDVKQSIPQCRLLGYIHTHPGLDTCQHPSDHDLFHAVGEGEQITGICHLFISPKKRKHSKFRFEIPRIPSVLKVLV